MDTDCYPSHLCGSEYNSRLQVSSTLRGNITLNRLCYYFNMIFSHCQHLILPKLVLIFMFDLQYILNEVGFFHRALRSHTTEDISISVAILLFPFVFL